MRFSPFAEDVAADPYAAYAVMRRDAPVWRCLSPPMTHLFGYADVSELLLDEETLARSPLALARPEEAPEPWRRLHDAFRRALGPQPVSGLETSIRAIADHLLDHAGGGQVDIVTSLAYPLAARVSAQVLNIAPQESAALHGWLELMAAGINRRFLRHLEGAAVPAREPRAVGLTDLVTDLAGGAMGRARTPSSEPSALKVALATEHRRDPFSPAEVVSACLVPLASGFWPTAQLIAASVERAAKFGRADAFVDETLRHRPPLHALLRWARRDVRVGDAEVARGEMVVLWLGSANHDEACFERADEFWPERRPNRHLSFGLGPHACPGAGLARLEAKVAVEAVEERRQPEAPASVALAGPLLRGFSRLVVQLAPAT